MASKAYEIDVQTLIKMRRAGDVHTVLDVREPEEVAICSIEGSVFIPMREVFEKLDLLPTDHPLIVTCHVGGRSAMITEYLQNIGFDNALNLTGGIDAWAQIADPDMPRY